MSVYAHDLPGIGRADAYAGGRRPPPPAAARRRPPPPAAARRHPQPDMRMSRMGAL
jgi:hypothetical protein